MSAPTNEHQIIRSTGGTPLFAVIPWAEYEEVFDGRPDEAVFIPQEVVELVHLEDMGLIRAWREHLGLSQREVAKRMGVSQPAYAKMEAKGASSRVATLKKIAAALGVEWGQIRP
ncbi:MAG: helix-turn-helix transcriptional regulator [Desulfovibrionaceae bacterium]|jgi:DNA-binding XRE family transcriptional regulator|nr:helix-turn-helix transcriptional regulator [Desulfovibrionaceae bacterium]